MSKKKKSKPVAVQEWIVSRHPANPAIAQGYHLQVQTKDTLAGFVVVPGMIPLKESVHINRGKTPTGLDHFSLNLGNAITFTLVGRIEYRGDWEGIP
ncbi:MAG: hypothetical protein ACREDF_08275 [Thermoplasmata archaeon]